MYFELRATRTFIVRARCCARRDKPGYGYHHRPYFLSFCLDVQKNVQVHTYLYELHTLKYPSHPEAQGVDFRLVDMNELDRIIAFQQRCLDRGTSLSGWLRGYSSNLIERNELYALCSEKEWLGLGEMRKSDTQKTIVNLGMMVSPDYRKKGWATYILTCLSAQCETLGLKAICSTTVENTGAQRAITNAGFISRHCIMDIVL